MQQLTIDKVLSITQRASRYRNPTKGQPIPRACSDDLEAEHLLVHRNGRRAPIVFFRGHDEIASAVGSIATRCVLAVTLQPHARSVQRVPTRFIQEVLSRQRRMVGSEREGNSKSHDDQ